MAEELFNLPNFAKDVKFYRSFQKELEGVTYTFAIQYIARGDKFILRIGEDVKGRAITAGVDMLKQIHHLNVPPGELYTYDYDGLNRDPSRDTFGDRITLRYVES